MMILKQKKKDDEKPVKKKNHLELLTKIRNNKLKLVENNLMIKDTFRPQLPKNSKFKKPNKFNQINNDLITLNNQNNDNKYQEFIDTSNDKLWNNYQSSNINTTNQNKKSKIETKNQLNDNSNNTNFYTVDNNTKENKTPQSINQNQLESNDKNQLKSVKKNLKFDDNFDFDKFKINPETLDTQQKIKIASKIQKLENDIVDLINKRDFHFHYYDKDLEDGKLTSEQVKKIENLRNSVYDDHDRAIKKKINSVKKNAKKLYNLQEENNNIDEVKVKGITNYDHKHHEHLLSVLKGYKEDKNRMEKELTELTVKQQKFNDDFNKDKESNKYNKKESAKKLSSFETVNTIYSNQIKSIDNLLQKTNTYIDNLLDEIDMIEKEKQDEMKNKPFHVFNTEEKETIKENRRKMDEHY